MRSVVSFRPRRRVAGISRDMGATGKRSLPGTRRRSSCADKPVCPCHPSALGSKTPRKLEHAARRRVEVASALRSNKGAFEVS